jgi:hypothetical protein
MKINSLGYLRVESPDAKEWAHFGPEVLGLMPSEAPEDSPDTISLTPDDRPGRIQVTPCERNRLEAVGWEVQSAAAFDAAIADLERAGVELSRGTDAQRARAKVRDLVRFTDPAGHTHENFWGQPSPGALAFYAAREFLWTHRENYHDAYHDFRRPELGAFNWALDHFDCVFAPWIAESCVLGSSHTERSSGAISVA